MSAQPAQLSVHMPGGSPDLLRGELLTVIEQGIENRPRSRQQMIGPSGIGTPCVRRLGHQLAGTPAARTQEAAWLPEIGTAVHEQLASHFRADNEATVAKHGEFRWFVETRVQPGQIDGKPLVGSCDLYDVITGTVIDWKVVGVTTLREAKAKGPKPTYRVQAHTYGLGWENLGMPVDQVAVFYLPRNGRLSEGLFWTEPYDRQVALDGIARADALAAGIRLAGPQVVLPGLPTADDYCTHCPWFMPGTTDLTRACPGAADRTIKDPGLRDLLA